MRSVAGLALLAAGCAPTGAANINQLPASADASTANPMPLRYVVAIKNMLANGLTVTLTAPAGASLSGPKTFTIEPGKAKSATVRITTFAPGTIVAIQGTGAGQSQTLQNIVSIVDSSVAFRMHGLGGMDEKAAILRNKANTEVTVSIEADAPITASQAYRLGMRPSGATEYAVTLANDLPDDPLEVNVKTSESSLLKGDPSFSLPPDTSKTVRVTDTGVSSASDRFEVIDAATRVVKAKLELLKSGGDTVDISKMFEMQLLMNKFSQLTELSTSVISASNSAIATMARNVKT
jgi:Family of unknown function (DUF5407)